MGMNNTRKKLTVLATLALAAVFAPLAAAQETGVSTASQPAPAAGEIDYGNLSIRAAIDRLLEVDPQIKAKTLVADRARLAVKVSKLDAWLPELQFGASGVKPVDMFTRLKQYHGPFLGQQLLLDFSFDTNTIYRIRKEKKANQVALAEIKEVVTDRVRELVVTYYDLAAAQKGYQSCLRSEEEIKALLDQREKDPAFSGLERSGGVNYLSLVTEKKISAFNKIKNYQRKMKVLLGLEDRPDLEIAVNGLLDNIEQVKSLIEEAGLRQYDHRVDALMEKYEQAKVTEKITLNPLISLTLTPAFGIAEGRHEEFQTKLTNIFQVNLFLTDFGQTSGARKADRLKTNIAQLEVLKAEKDLEYSDFRYRSELAQLDKKIHSYREYIIKAEDALKVLKERVTFSFDTLLEISDQLLEARYALKQMLSNYLVTFSKMTGKELPAEKTSPEFQDMTLAKLLDHAAEGEKLTEQQILERTIELEKMRHCVAKLGYLPKLFAAARIENDNIAGIPQQITKSMLMLEGRFLDNKVKYFRKETEAALKIATWQLRVFENTRQDAILTNYVQALRLERTIAGLSEIKRIKDGVIEAMKADMASGRPRYAEAEILPLILQQMELDRTIADLEILLSLAHYALKKWVNIPLNEKITLKKINTADKTSDRDFLTVIIQRILSDYDPEAPVKAVMSGVEGAKAAESRESAFEGIAWRVKGEVSGADFDAWTKPDSSVTLSLIMPWENRGWRVPKAAATRKRLEAQLNYVRAQKDLAVEKKIATERAATTKDVLEIMRRKVVNAENRFKIMQNLFEIGARTPRELASVQLEVISARFECDEAFFDDLYAHAKEMMIFGMVPTEEKGSPVILSSLQEAIDLALENSSELKVFEEKVKLEEETLRYYKTFSLNGIAAGDLAYLRSRDSHSDQLTKTGVAVANVNISFINRLLLEEQRKRIELAKMDLERERFRITIDIVDTYADYVNAMAEYAAIHAEGARETAILESMKDLLKSGAITQVDYLKQEELVELLAQKARNVKKFCEIPRNLLGVLVGGSDVHFSNIHLEIYDAARKRIVPAEDGAIKEKLLAELVEAQKALLSPLGQELSSRLNLETDIGKLNTKRISKQIKTIGVKVGYSFLSDYLGDRANGETTFSQFDQLGLNLLSDKSTKKMSEFVSVNTYFKVYDATISTQARIGSIEENIAAVNARADLAQITQKAEALFDEYQSAVRNYQNWVRNAAHDEEETKQSLERAKESGKLTLARQMEIKQNLLNNRMKRIAAFYKAMRFRNELDQYLRRYTGKGFEDFVNFQME